MSDGQTKPRNTFCEDKTRRVFGRLAEYIEDLRRLVAEAEAENYGPVARVSVGLLSPRNLAFVGRILDAEASGATMVRLSFVKKLLAEVTEVTT